MFFLVLRKIFNNKWLMGCLLAGSILAVAMVSSIPLYTDGILQRMLTKDLESFQTSTGYYPGRYVFSLKAFTYYSGSERLNAYRYFDQNVGPLMADKLDLPYLSRVTRVGMDHMTVLPKVPKTDQEPQRVYMSTFGLTDLENHITLLAGRMPAKEAVNGVYEVLIDAGAQKACDLTLDEEIIVTDTTKQLPDAIYKIVGIFQRAAGNDTYWSEPAKMYETALFMDYNLMLKDLIYKNDAIVSGYWYFALDYSKITVDRLEPILKLLDGQQKYMTSFRGTSWDFPALKILQQYQKREQQLKLTLWVLQVPILLMLAFYIFMVTQLIVENDKNEIAVLKSRGAGRGQVFSSYLMQSLLLSGVAVVLGPMVGMLICTVLGASNGFLEFVARTALPLRMSGKTLLYALYAGMFSVVMMMIPALLASQMTIVEHKQRKSRRWNAPVWQKFFLDFVFIALSLYGLYSYGIRQQTVLVTSAEGMDVPIDPFLFLISTLFVLGAGMLFLRLYPYVIRLISWAGRKVWTPVLYTAFIQVGRSTGREQFLMLFLILTVSIGVFSANSARTINQNIEDKVHYSVGADVTLQMKWESNEKTYTAGPQMGPPTQSAGSASDATSVVTYIEPDFGLYSKLDGTSAAARVYVGDQLQISDSHMGSTRLGVVMAVEPNEFGKVCWSAAGLYGQYHINDYLNLLAISPNAVLVSQAVMTDLNLQPGDSIYYSIDKQAVEGVVYAAVNFWPGINPYTEKTKYFVISNLRFAQTSAPKQPYQIWYQRAPGATSEQIIQAIEDKEMKLESFSDARQAITLKKNDPLLLGTNGAMTLGFVVTMAISMIGFFIYWILSIQSRTLQFGIFRAMGMTSGRVILTLVCEQIMISGVAIVMGLVIGGMMCQLFVPLLSLVYSSADQVPPFRVIASRSDYLNLYAVIGFMLAAGLGMLGVLVSRIKVAQAIKLGED